MTDAVDVVEFIEEQMDEMKILPKAWKHCTIPTVENLRNMSTFRALVWETEGVFKGDKWHFNEAHADYEPVLIDRNTASLFVQAYDMASDGSKLILIGQLNSRGRFCHLAEWLWSKATFK